MEGWVDAGGQSDRELRRFLHDQISDPEAWAVLDGPKVALLFDNRTVLVVTAAEDDVKAALWHFPEGTEVVSESGKGEERCHTQGKLTHWTFDRPDAEPLKVTGWDAPPVNNRPRQPDQPEQLARALASACGWPFDRSEA
jgi:hypothetical protein